MSHAQERLARAYALLLRLYPPRFRAEFEEEMRAVFAERLAALRGLRAGLGLLLAEAAATPRALAAAYRLQTYRPGLPAGWRERLLAALLPALEGPPDADGPAPRGQTALELLPFLLAALWLAFAAYLPLLAPTGRTWPPPALQFTVGLVPLLLTVVGLRRGLPRWAYPWAGLTLGSVAVTTVEARALPALALTAAGGGLAFLLVRAALHAPLAAAPPAWLVYTGQGLRTNPARAAFGLYGLLPFALRLAFDDGFLDYRTPFLAVGLICMVCGAYGFTRARRLSAQAAALLAGQTGALGMALLDGAAHGYSLVRQGLAAPGSWVALEWLALAALMSLPFLTTLRRKKPCPS